MPQITSCPECSKQLRVPDELIGKKVKCPGCATMFIAESDDQEEEEAPKKASERNRSDNVTSRGKSRDDDEDDAPRSRRRDRDDEDEDEAPPKAAGRGRSDGVTSTPRGKSRDDDRDDAPRSRGRVRDEDDDRRPSRSRRDDEDDEDRRPRRSRDDDDDDDDDDRRSRRRRDDEEPSIGEQRRGWQKVRTGTNFVLISGWLYLSLIGISIVFTLIMALIMGIASTTRVGGGFPTRAGSGAGAIGVLSCGVSIVMVLLGLSAFVLLMVGTGFCMATPQLRGQAMRRLAMTAFYLYVGAIGACVLGFLALALMPPLGVMVLILAMLAYFAGHIVWMVYLRLVCLYFKDSRLASAVMSNLIAQIVAPIVGTIVLVILGFALQSTGAAGGIVTFVFSIVNYVVMIGIFIWYLMTLKNVRDLVDR